MEVKATAEEVIRKLARSNWNRNKSDVKTSKNQSGYPAGYLELLDWTTGLEYWTGILDLSKPFPISFPDQNNIGVR